MLRRLFIQDWIRVLITEYQRIWLTSLPRFLFLFLSDVTVIGQLILLPPQTTHHIRPAPFLITIRVFVLIPHTRSLGRT